MLVSKNAEGVSLSPRGPWQQTASGGAFYLTDPRPNEVAVEDIAQALSRICRYNGHLRAEYPLYSVAQHAVTVAHWMAEDGHPDRVAYAALHHDSAEAYYGDIITQVKYAVPALKAFMRPVDEAVAAALEISVTEEERREIKQYDLIALATESRDVLVEGQMWTPAWVVLPEARMTTLTPRGQLQAYREFLSVHWTLRTGMGKPAMLPSDHMDIGAWI